jgi:hypothetical protein
VAPSFINGAFSIFSILSVEVEMQFPPHPPKNQNGGQNGESMKLNVDKMSVV